MGHKMNEQEIRAFLLDAPRTGHVATVRDDGRPHVAAVWFTVDGEDIVFTTWHTSVKGKNLRRTGFAALSVDDETPPFSWVVLEGPVVIDDDPERGRYWATIIAARYMGADRAEEFGERNGIPGEVVCRLTPSHQAGMFDITD